MTESANTIRTSKLMYDGKTKLFGQNVTPGMMGSEFLCKISELVEKLFTDAQFDCIDLEKDLGITCPDPNKTKQCIVIEYLIQGLTDANAAISVFTKSLQIIKTSIGLLKDEKVKVRSAGSSGYLEDIFEGPANTITFSNNKVTFSGFMPVGARARISASRVGDFDSTGKGKVGTDLWGWAINNGNNGVRNLLGVFSMNTDTLLNADQTGGASSFTVLKENIKTFSLPISGTIGNALENNVKFQIQIAKRNKCFGLFSCRDVLVPDPGADATYDTNAKNFQHSHTYNLAANHLNTTPTPIPLIPAHIKEIPIERIIP